MRKKKVMAAAPLSIVDLAAELGVSHTTISRVINSKPGVSSELAARIRQRMRDIGYQPRVVRPGPRRREEPNAAVPGREGTIGFVYLGNAISNLPAGMINLALAASDAATAAGYDLLFAEVSSIKSLPSWLRDGRVNGLMLCGYRCDDETARYLASFPSVWLSSHAAMDGSRAVDRVLSGNTAAGKLAAEYLAKRGHKRLGFINPLAGWQLFQTRGDAFDLAARRRGATVIRVEAPSGPDEVIFELSREQLEDRIAPLVDELCKMPASERPTGLFLTDGPVALAFYRCAYKRGVVIGRDFDVITFGTHIAFGGLSPMPAHVAVPENVRGVRAVSQLLWRIKHPGEERGMEVSIDPQVVEGEIQWPPANSR